MRIKNPDDKAVRFSITIPEDLRNEMKKHPEVNWSRVAAVAFERQLRVLELLEQIAEPGITDEEAARRVLETRRKLLAMESKTNRPNFSCH